MLDSAADVDPISIEEFRPLADERVVPIDEATKKAILEFAGDTTSREVASVAKHLRDGADSLSLKELAPVIARRDVSAIAAKMASHDDSVIRFFANLVWAGSGDSDSADAVYALIHDESLSLIDKRVIRTWCNGVGIRTATDNPKKILEHLTTMSRNEPKFKNGDIAPEFAVTTTNGLAISSANLRGRIVVLHFWSTSCGPCIGRMPSHIASLARHDPKDVEIVFVSLDDDEQAFKSAVERFKIPFNNIRDGRGWGGELVRDFGVNRKPFDVIIDAEGKIASNSIDDIAEILRGQSRNSEPPT